jgi:hypothetical protein
MTSKAEHALLFKTNMSAALMQVKRAMQNCHIPGLLQTAFSRSSRVRIGDG